MCGKVTAILRSDQYFGSDYLKGGLKSITTKQFFSILAFFMKALSGNRFTIGINPPDDIMKFLSAINYPYLITKSSLKTPNSPHSFPTIVHILTWLCEFLDGGDPIEHFEHSDYVVVDKQFPDAEYTKLFWENIKENFCYWNNEQDSKVEMCRDWLIDECIRKRVGITSRKQLESEISTQRKKYNDLLRERFSVKKEELLSDTRTKLQRFEQERADLQMNNEKLLLQVKLLRDDDTEKSLILAQKHDKINRLESIIAAQKWSVQDFQKFAEELCIKKQHCINEQEALHHQTDAVRFPAEVEVARLQKQLVDIVVKHNAYIGGIYKSVRQFDSLDIDLTALIVASDTLVANSFDEKIVSICMWLERYIKKVNEVKAIKLEKIKQMEAKLKVAKYEADLMVDNKSKIAKQLAEIQSNIQSNKVAILDGQHLRQEAIAKCHRRCTIIQSEIDELCQHIKEKKKKATELNEENGLICALVKEKAEEMLVAQQRDLAECRIILDEFRHSMEEVNGQLDKMETKIGSDKNVS